MTETVLLTYRELAARLGITVNSARIKARRRKWRIVPGNHPLDPARVEVPPEWLSPVAVRGAREGDGIPMSPGDAPPVLSPATSSANDVMVPLATAIALIAGERQYRDAETARLQAVHREVVASLERANAAAAAQHREAMAMMVERVDAAEVRAEYLTEQLSQVLGLLISDRHLPTIRLGWTKWWKNLFENK